VELRNKRVLVVGFAATGMAATRFLLQRQARVSITDTSPSLTVPEEFVSQGVVLEAGEHRVSTFLAQDLIIVSPGVPLSVPPLQEARARGIEVLSEIELAYRFLRTPLIAVTGTNGKTTTTSLLGHMFTAGGARVFVGGNIGTPLIEYVLGSQAADYVICELSSFQLEGIASFRPAISVLLNITEDHLDRYACFDDYVEAKARIYMNQLTPDIAVLNVDDPRLAALLPRIRADIFSCSTARPLATGAYYDGMYHFKHADGRQSAFAAQDALLEGAHNRENMLAAASVGFLCNLPAAIIRNALLSFVGLPHRMEFVAAIDGVGFYNDSKGTNVGACQKSLESLAAPLILIAGGKDKGGSYRPLLPLVKTKVRALVLLGEAKDKMLSELGAAAPTVMADSLEQAVRESLRHAKPGDTVLFSPACSSFDMFKSYAHRGDCFKSLVKALAAQSNAAATGPAGSRH